jgi:GNAT superfamily N-acetyltransferase
MNITIKTISATETLDVRHPILRTGKPRAEAILPYDTHVDAIHLGAFDDSNLIGVSSLFHEDMQNRLQKNIWRLRAMAVLEAYQGQGIGKQLVMATIEHAKTNKATLLWCTARAHASVFYEKCGFHKEGHEFDIPGIGPHFNYVLNLK